MRQSRTMRVKKRLLCMPVVVLRHWDSAFASKLLFLVFDLVETILRPTSSLESRHIFRRWCSFVRPEQQTEFDAASSRYVQQPCSFFNFDVDQAQ
eukprot:3072679-Rhodomonas_salina.1